MAKRTAIIGFKELEDGSFQLMDATGQTRRCGADPFSMWRCIQQVLDDGTLPRVVEAKGRNANGNGATPKQDEEAMRKIGDAIVGEMGPVGKAAAPFVFKKIHGLLRKVSGR